MIVVTTTDGVRHEFATGQHIETEEVFNNLLVQDASGKKLLAVFAHDRWVSVEIA